MELIIAMILLLGPDHQLVGGKILPGASPTMADCYKKTHEFALTIHALPPNTIAIEACSVLKKEPDASL